MTKLDVRQRRSGGKFTKRFDIYLVDRRAPEGDLYASGLDIESARKVIAFEVKAFEAMGLPLTVAGLPA